MNYTGSLGLAPLSWVEPGQLDVIPANYNVSATSTFTGAGDASEVRDKPVAATNSFTGSGVTTKIRDVNGACASSFTTSGSAQEALNFEINKSAASSFTLGRTATESRDALASASSSFAGSSHVIEYTDIPRSATGPTVTLSTTASETLGNLFNVSAANTFQLHPIGISFFTGEFYPYAVSQLVIAPQTRCSLNHVTVTPSNALRLGGVSTSVNIGFKNVNATSSIGLAGVSSKMKIGPVPVSATNSFTLRGTPGRIADLFRSLNSTFTAHSSASAVRNLVKSAVNGFNAAATSTTTNIKHKSATNSFTMSETSTKAIGSTLIGSTFSIGGRSSASIKLPWRKRPLNRPPGGNIPHS